MLTIGINLEQFTRAINTASSFNESGIDAVFEFFNGLELIGMEKSGLTLQWIEGNLNQFTVETALKGYRDFLRVGDDDGILWDAHMLVNEFLRLGFNGYVFMTRDNCLIIQDID